MRPCTRRSSNETSRRSDSDHTRAASAAASRTCASWSTHFYDSGVFFQTRHRQVSRGSRRDHRLPFRGCRQGLQRPMGKNFRVCAAARRFAGRGAAFGTGESCAISPIVEIFEMLAVPSRLGSLRVLVRRLPGGCRSVSPNGVAPQPVAFPSARPHGRVAALARTRLTAAPMVSRCALPIDRHASHTAGNFPRSGAGGGG